ncbi:MAG: DNA primase [Candidatus Caccovivens sp.]
MQSRGFPVDWLTELKRKNDLVSIASNYLKLEQKGSRFWACCPFHNEKTPSFAISNEGIYHCFGCKESGDVIKFVQKMENVDFLDAVKILADKVGMQLPELQSSDKRKENQKQKERMLSALDYAYKHYMENLYNKDAKVAQDYIKQRKFTRRELEDFKIGYSKNWTDIVQYLKSKGFSEKEMLDAGICQKKSGGDNVIDAYGGRLIFPIFNAFNECVGFSGRTLEKNPEFAKYKNTAETLVFQKRKIVFGINILKAQKQQQLVDKIILVEGQMDVIAMHKAGFKSTVACMGTALTQEHVQELKRYSSNIYLCFDGDGAGTKATLHAIEMFRNENVNLKVVRYTGGKDPDEVLNNLGKEKLQEFIDNAMPYMEFLIEYYRSKHDLKNAEEKGKFVKEILAEIKKLGSETLFEPYLEKIRDITKIPLDILRRDINVHSEKPTITKKETNQTSSEKSDDKAVKYILASLLHKKSVVDDKIDYRRLLEGYEWYLDIIDQNLPLSSIFDIEGASEDDFLMDIVNFNFSLFENDEERYFKECLWKVAEQVLKKMQAKLNEEYKVSEDLDKRAEIAKKMGKIVMQLNSKSLEEFNVRRKI